LVGEDYVLYAIRFGKPDIFLLSEMLRLSTAVFGSDIPAASLALRPNREANFGCQNLNRTSRETGW
jgi:hypothetical protein